MRNVILSDSTDRVTIHYIEAYSCLCSSLLTEYVRVMIDQLTAFARARFMREFLYAKLECARDWITISLCD